MRNGLSRLTISLCLCLAAVGFMAVSAFAKIPEGHRDVKLGMNKAQVLEVLKKNPMHTSYDDMGVEIGEIIRGDDLFRFATYRFDGSGTLVEIDLQMREILGRDRVIERFNDLNGLKVSPSQAVVDQGRAVEVRDNRVILRISPVKGAQASKTSP